MSSKNNNSRGIILILLAMMVFSVQDGIMKHIFSFVSLYEVYLIRTLVSFILILLFLLFWFGVGFHCAQLSSIYGVLLYPILDGFTRHACLGPRTVVRGAGP